MTSALAMTIDVKALREVCERIIDLEAKRENAADFAHRAAAHAALSMACETFAHTLPPTAVLALLDRLERAEANAEAGLALRRRMCLGVGHGVMRECPADALRLYDSTFVALAEKPAAEVPHCVGDVWERSDRLVVRELGVDGQPLRLHHDTLGERWWSVRGLVDAGWRRVSRAALDDEAPR